MNKRHNKRFESDGLPFRCAAGQAAVQAVRYVAKKNMNKIRKWINKDDGKYYQVGNFSLTWLEILGAFIAIAGLVIWTAADKINASSAESVGRGR